jgi:hypothetical protein
MQSKELVVLLAYSKFEEILMKKKKESKKTALDICKTIPL